MTDTLGKRVLKVAGGIYLLGWPVSLFVGTYFLDSGQGALADAPGLWLLMVWAVGIPVILVFLLTGVVGVLFIWEGLTGVDDA